MKVLSLKFVDYGSGEVGIHPAPIKNRNNSLEVFFPEVKMIGTQQELSRFPKYLNDQYSRNIILNHQFFLNRKSKGEAFG
jgi:hypothetical protein